MNVGGPAWQASVLTDGLLGEGFETRLLAGRLDSEEDSLLQLRRLKLSLDYIDELSRSIHPISDSVALMKLVRRIKAYQPDVVHTHMSKAGVLGRIAAKIANVPVIVHTFHGHLLHGYFAPPITNVIVNIERRLATFTDMLISVGSSVRDDLVAAGIADSSKFAVVPPGVDDPGILDRQGARRDLGIPLGAKVVLYVGRLTAIKRPDRLSEVALRLCDRNPDVVVLVAGRGDCTGDVEEAADRQERIRFLGWQRDVWRLYAASDTAILTSDNEGMPVSLIEAHMAGRPCVSTDVGSVREVVLDGETGFVTRCSSDDLVEATEKVLLQAELRSAFSSRAREWAQHAFGTNRLISETGGLYRDLLND